MGQVFGTVGKLQLVETITLSAAGTTFDFTGLSGNDTYMIELSGENNTATGANISLFINNDTTATNYYTQLLRMDHNTLTGVRSNAANICNLDVSSFVYVDINLNKTLSGYVFAFGTANHLQGSTIRTDLSTVSKTATVADITQITLTSGQNFKIGSKASLYKVVE